MAGRPVSKSGNLKNEDNAGNRKNEDSAGNRKNEDHAPFTTNFKEALMRPPSIGHVRPGLPGDQSPLHSHHQERVQLDNPSLVENHANFLNKRSEQRVTGSPKVPASDSRPDYNISTNKNPNKKVQLEKKPSENITQIINKYPEESVTRSPMVSDSGTKPNHNNPSNKKSDDEKCCGCFPW